MVGAVLGAVVGGLLLVIAATIVRFNWKRVHISRAAAKASDEQLDSIYRMVEACGSEKPAGCILARTNRSAEDTACVIPIPDWIEDFPWAGRSIMVEAASEVSFRFTEGTSRAVRCLGKEFKAVAAPRTRSKSGKLRNILSPDRYIALNPALLPALREICPKYPKEQFSYLFNSGADTFEFDSINQARIGTSPAWAQQAEFPSCDQCKERMAFILQLPGSMVAMKRWGSGIFYWGARDILNTPRRSSNSRSLRTRRPGLHGQPAGWGRTIVSHAREATADNVPSGGFERHAKARYDSR